MFQPADITIVKAMKNPPAGVKLVMAAVCVMMDMKAEKINDPSGTGQKVLICIYFAFKITLLPHVLMGFYKMRNNYEN